MSGGYLDDIAAYHRARASADDRIWQSRDAVSTAPSLTSALRAHRDHGLAVIAEVKRRSPSRGWLAPDLDAALISRAYVAGGASGVSVLTDEPYFGGSLDDLRVVHATVSVPVLRKDFIVGPNDVIDAAEAGASALLLIVAILTDRELATLLALARARGLDALVEVHDDAEAARAANAGAELVGVNQRDLRTFEIDPRRAAAVARSLPVDAVAVAESGIRSVADATRAAESGFDAILVGESLVTAIDPSRAVAELVGAPIGVRA